MEGTFDLLGPIELIQLLAQSRQSGVFSVPGGEVYLEGGRPVHATYNGQSGSKGFYRILSLSEGKFRYLAGERAPTTSLTEPLENYLLTAIQVMDAKLDLSPFDQIELIDAAKATHLTLAPDDFALLGHLGKPLALFELVAASGLDFDRAGAVLSRLARVGLIRVTRRTPRTVRLQVGRLQGIADASVDAQLLRAWRGHYGPFADLEVKAGGRTLRLHVQPVSGAGARLLLSDEVLFRHDLSVGQEVLAWPAL